MSKYDNLVKSIATIQQMPKKQKSQKKIIIIGLEVNTINYL